MLQSNNKARRKVASFNAQVSQFGALEYEGAGVLGSSAVVKVMT